MSTHDYVKTIKAAKDAAAKLSNTEAELRAQHEALVKERERTYSSVRSLPEVQANIDSLVDGTAAKWAKDHGHALVKATSGGYEVRGTTELRETYIRPKLPEFVGLNGVAALTFADLCALLPEQMKARLRHVAEHSGQPFGPSESERTARLAELDAQIVALETSHTQLVDAAGEVGIELPVLRTVAKRRADEAAEVERQAAIEEARSRGAYPIGA